MIEENKNKGIRVAHDLKDLNPEENVILTLQDEEIIKGNKYNDFQDTLHNDIMTSNFKAEFNSKLREKLLNNNFNSLEDPEGDILNGTILPQYDELKPEKEGFLLDSDNLQIMSDKQSALDSINKKLGVQGKSYFDLDVEKKVANEFMTKDEFKMRKRKKRRKKKKRGGKLGKKKGDFSFLRELEEEVAEDINSASLGKRGANKVGDGFAEELEEKQRKKLKTYHSVVENASNATKNNMNFEDAVRAQEEDDHNELIRLLGNAKKKARTQAKKAEEKLKELLEENGKVEKRDGNRVEEKGVVFDEDEDHFESVKQKVKEMGKDYEKIKRENILNLGDVGNGRASVIDVLLPSERFRYKEEEDIKTIPNFANPGKIAKEEMSEETASQSESKNMNSQDEKEEEEKKEDDSNPLDENDEDILDLKSSAVAALNLFRKRGMLSKDKTVNYIGRSNDVKFHKEMERVGGDTDRIKLEYRDKRTGRLMTQKEAFNDMCRTFHNIRPSKKKQAKMLKKQRAIHHSRYTNPTDSKSYKLMKKVQEISKLPYIDISKRV